MTEKISLLIIAACNLGWIILFFVWMYRLRRALKKFFDSDKPESEPEFKRDSFSEQFRKMNDDMSGRAPAWEPPPSIEESALSLLKFGQRLEQEKAKYKSTDAGYSKHVSQFILGIASDIIERLAMNKRDEDDN